MASITVSGTAYTDRGVTTMGSGRTINVSVNGAASAASATTAADGTFTTGSFTSSAADVITVYIQDGTNPEKAATVTRSTGANMTGIDLYQNNLVLRSDDGTALSGTNLNTSDANGATGISAIYTASSNTSLVVASGKSLCIMSGQTFSPGGAATVSVGGDWVNNGTYTTSTGAVTLTGTGSQILKTNGSVFRSLTINGSGGTYTLQDALTVGVGGSGALTLTAGTLDVSASNFGVTILGSGGIATTSGAFTARSGTVTFGASATLNMGGSSLYDLVISSGTTSLTGALTVTHSLTISSGKTFRTLGLGLTLTGATFTNSGTLQVRGGETLTGFTNDVSNGGTVTFAASATVTGLNTGNSYANLSFINTQTYQPTADLTVTGTLTIGTSGVPVLDMSSANKNITVGGNWVHTGGTFTPGTGRVTLNGSTQTISGSTTFYDLTASTPDQVITVTDGTTQTVSHSFTSQGTSGHNVVWQGSSTGGWTIAMPATQTIGYVTVSYSTATGNVAAAGATSTDGGNNVNWTFSSAAAASGPRSCRSRGSLLSPSGGTSFHGTLVT